MAPRDGDRRGRWTGPTIRLRPALQLLGFFLAVGVLRGIAMGASYSARELDISCLAPILWGVTGALAAWIAFPTLQTAVQNAGDLRAGWVRFVCIHVAGYALFAAVHIGVMLGLRQLLAVVTGPAMVPTSPLRSQVLEELGTDIIVYAGLAALWTLLKAWEERAAGEIRASQLEARLARTRLQALSAQVDPHFLLNALNTVGSVAHEDLDRSDRLLASLGSILRATLQSQAPTWRVRDEIKHARSYLALLEARFEDHIQVGWEVAAEAGEQELPRFAIQTLLENAVKHNQDRIEPLAVRVVVRVEAGALRVEVTDNGCGFNAGGPGVGSLARLAETLRLLHGAGAALETGSVEPSGARVTLVVPAQVEG